MKIIRILLIAVAIFIALRLIMRYVGPLLLKWLKRKMMERVKRQFDPGYQPDKKSRRRKKEKTGQQTIYRTKDDESKNRSSDKEMGEYIDYEEID